MTKYWIGVASLDHVKIGANGGFSQLCHGKKIPLAKMKEGDWLIYYSPKTSLRSGIPYQKFTAIGRVTAGDLYMVEMNNGFKSYRKNVDFIPDIHEVSLTSISTNHEWQQVRSKLRFGHFEISASLFDQLSSKMRKNERLS